MLPGITKTFFAEGRGESGNDAYTVLLLHFDSDYIDYSLGATGPVRTFVRGSGAIRESSGGKFGGGRLRVGDVDTSRISTTQSVDFDFGAGDFTIDYWVLRNSDGTCEHISKRSDSGYGPWVIQYSGGFLYFYASVSGTAWDISAWPIATISLGVWTHIALVRNGTTLKSYVNGVLYATMTSSISLQAASNRLNIGGLGVAGCSSPNYFDEIRISKGIARWTANFTPRTSAYGPNPNRDVLLLMHFDDANGTPFGSFIDSSPFSRGPFQANGSPYIVNPGGNLGSGVVVFPNDAGRHYFVPMQSIDFDFMGDDFTIEWWEYRVGDLVNDARPSFLRENDAVVYQSFLIGWNEGGTLKFYWSHDGANWGAGAPLVLGATTSAWTHYAVVRKGGTFYGFRNGILQDTKAVTGALMPGVANQYLSVGYWNYGPGYLFVGYMDEIRISKIARWTADFPVPTIPYGYDPVLYSVVLYITAEGSITDISAWQRPINNQGVAIDNNTMRFIPNTYLTVSNTNELQIRNKDFTIEAWLMARSIPGGNQRFYVHSSSTTDNNNGIFLGYHVDGSFDARINGAGIVLNTGPGVFAIWQWHHYAFVRYGDKWSLFIDGVERVNQTLAVTVTDFAYGPHIGVIPGGSEWMSGFIDNFKFTNGVALYTNNFTPTAPPAIPENVKAATYFVLSAPGTMNVNQTYTVYIQAYNATGVAVNYNGIIRITSNDPAATLPGDIPYNSLYGQGAFNVTLRNYGNPYYIYATDISTTGITGNSNGINVPSPVWRETYISAVGYGEMYVPGGWSTTNIIECIAGGAAGQDSNYYWNGGVGGGGGGYARSDNVGWGPGSYLGYVVGDRGAPSGNYGGDCWFGDPNVCRSQGGQGQGAGGVYAAYTVAHNGGTGGNMSSAGGGGGGGGAGMYGYGAPGGHNFSVSYFCSGGGGGHGGGAAGGNAGDSFNAGGNGGNSYAWGGGGATGTFGPSTATGGNGANGGGGGGGSSDQNSSAYWGGHGSNGPEWGTNLGSGGGGGAATVGPAGYGGAWGGGGGGGGLLGSGGYGHQGLIRLRWYGP